MRNFIREKCLLVIGNYIEVIHEERPPTLFPQSRNTRQSCPVIIFDNITLLHNNLPHHTLAISQHLCEVHAPCIVGNVYSFIEMVACVGIRV
jgi:hypothetical protein